MKAFHIYLLFIAALLIGNSAKSQAAPTADSCLKLVIWADTNYIIPSDWNKDSVKMDKCQGSPTFGQFFGKKVFSLAFPANFYPFDHILDSNEIKSVSEIDSAHLGFLNRFLGLQDTFGLIYFQGNPGKSADSIEYADPTIRMFFANYQDILYIKEHFKTTIDSIVDIRFLSYPVMPCIVPGDKGMKANNKISEIYTVPRPEGNLNYERNFRPNGFQSYLYSIFSPMAWEITYGSTDVVIDINDEKSAPSTHSDVISNNISAPAAKDINRKYYSVDAETKNGPLVRPLHSTHGLATASIAVAQNDNGYPMVGSAPRCKSICTISGDEYRSSEIDLDGVVNGIYKFPDVRNMSYHLTDMGNEDIEKGIVCVAAGGNRRGFNFGSATQKPNYLWEFSTIATRPASLTFADPSAPNDPDRDYKVICVGATQCGERLNFNTCNTSVDYWDSPMHTDNTQFIPEFNFSPGADKFNRSTNNSNRLFAKRNAMMDIVAPGSVLAANPNSSEYNAQSIGTSAATPIVSGIVGMMLSANKFMGVPLNVDGFPINGRKVHRRAYDILTFTAKKIQDFQNFDLPVNGVFTGCYGVMNPLSGTCTFAPTSVLSFDKIRITDLNRVYQNIPTASSSVITESEPIYVADNFPLEFEIDGFRIGGTSHNAYVSIFIDYNNSGTFTQAGELVYSGSSAGSHSVVIPIAELGDCTYERRMRIVCSLLGSGSSTVVTTGCGTTTSGQAYDFKLITNSQGRLSTSNADGTGIQYNYITQWNDKLKRSWAQRVGFGLVDAYRAVAHSIMQKGEYEYDLNAGNLDLDFAADHAGDARGYTMPAANGTPYGGKKVMHWGSRVKVGYDQTMFDLPPFRAPGAAVGDVVSVLDEIGTTDVKGVGGVSLPGEFHNNQGVTKLTTSDEDDETQHYIEVPEGCILAIDGIVFSDKPNNNYYVRTSSTNSSIIEMEGMVKDIELYGNLRIGDVILDGTIDVGEGSGEESGQIGFGHRDPAAGPSHIYGKVDVINKGLIYSNGEVIMQPGSSVNLNGEKDFRLKSGWFAEKIIRRNVMKHNTKITSSTGRKVTVEDGVVLYIDNDAVATIDCELNIKSNGTVILLGGSVAKVKYLNVEEGGTIIIDSNATLVLKDAKHICNGNFKIDAVTEQKAKIVGALAPNCLPTDALSSEYYPPRVPIYSDYPYIQTQPIIYMQGNCENEVTCEDPLSSENLNPLNMSSFLPSRQSLSLKNAIFKDVAISGSNIFICEPIDSCEFYTKTGITNPEFKFDYQLSLFYDNCQTCEEDKYNHVLIKNCIFKDLTQPLPPPNNTDINKLVYNTGGVIIEGYDVAEVQQTRFANLEFGVNTFDCVQTYIHNSRFDSCGIGDYDFGSTTLLCQDTFNLVKFGSVRDRSLTGKVFNNEYNKSRIAFSAISSQEQRLRNNIFNEYVVGISTDCTPIRIGDMVEGVGEEAVGIIYGRNWFKNETVSGYPNSYNNYLSKECENTLFSADISINNACCSLFMACGHNHMSEHSYYHIRYRGAGGFSVDGSHNYFPPTLFPIATSIKTNCTVSPGMPPSISNIEDMFDDYYCCGDITNNQGVTSCNKTEASPYSETCGTISFDHPYSKILHGSGLLLQNKDNKARNTLIGILQKNEFMAMYGNITNGKSTVENLSKLSDVMDENRDLSTTYTDFDMYKILIDLKLHKAGRLNSYPTAITGQPNIQRMFAREGSSNTSTSNSLLNYSGSRIDFKCENTSGIDDNSEENIMLQNFGVTIEPNPVNDATNISFNLPTKSRIKVYLTNALGEVVDNISNAVYSEGRNTINYQNSTLSNGVYYCIFEWKGGMKSEKIMLIR